MKTEARSNSLSRAHSSASSPVKKSSHWFVGVLLVRSRNRFGDYYRRCRESSMCHGEALKAVARKRLKVIYAIMRDKVPYAAWRAAENHSAQRPRWRGPTRALPQEPGNASIRD